MTAPARSNVIHLDSRRPVPFPRPAAGSQHPGRRTSREATSAPARALPARWSPRPLRVVARRVARSGLARDLHRNRDLIAVLLGLIAAGLLCLHTPLLDLIHQFTGGTTP